MYRIGFALRVLLALVFLSAALGKTRHRLAFQGVVANYRLLPEVFVPAFSLLLPLIEAALAGALLVAPPFWPAVSGALLLILFAAAMTVNLLRGRRHINCGCFQSALKQRLSWTLVARNLALALLLMVPASVPDATPLDFNEVEALLMSIVLFVLLQTMNVLWSVEPAWRLRDALPSGAKK